MSTFRNNNDAVMEELLLCQGNARCVLTKLDQLSLYSCDFTLVHPQQRRNVVKFRLNSTSNSIATLPIM